MKKRNKFTAATTATAIAAAMALPTAAFASTTFTDVSGLSTESQQAIQQLVDAGILNGVDTQGHFAPKATLTRAQFAKIVVLSLGVTVDTSKTTSSNFSDVTGWAAGYVDAAKSAGLIDGVGNGKFDPDGTVTREQAAKILVNALASKQTVTQTSDMTFTDVKDAWAVPFVATAAKYNLIKGYNNTTFGATDGANREQAALLASRLIGQIKPVEVTEQASAVGAKLLKVTFNQAVDTSKATISVAKGSVATNVSSVAWSDDKTTATLTLSTKLTEGDYTVTVKGLGDKDLTSTVSVEDEHVAKIAFASTSAAATLDGANAINGATLGFSVQNQYGEDITSLYGSSVKFTTSYGTALGDANGLLTLTGTFTLGQTVTVTGVDSTSGTVATTQVTISNQAGVDATTLGGVYDLAQDGVTLDTGVADYSNYVVLVSAKDQYGNAITDPAKFNAQTVVTSSNPSVVSVGGVNAGVSPAKTVTLADGTTSLAIPLAAPTGTKLDGTATIRVISKLTGKTSTYDVNVKKASTADTISLSAPTVTVATGETVEIPFNAADQYGDAVTSYTGLHGVVSTSATAGTLQFDNDYVNSKAVLDYTAPSVAGTYVLMAVTPSGKVSQVNVVVKDEAVPTVVAATADINGALEKDGTATITADNIVVDDQYGRPVTLDSNFFSNYKIKVATTDASTTKLTVDGGASAYINATSDATASGTVHPAVTLKGVSTTTGVQSVTLSLEYIGSDPAITAGPVTGSEYDFNEKTVAKADIANYKADDVANIYADGASGTYEQALNVYGVLADGTKVSIPSTQYNVTSNLSSVTYVKADGAFDEIPAANTLTFDSTTGTITGSALIIVDGASGPQSITKTITVSNAAPVPTTITAATAGLITIDSTGKVATGAVSDVATTANVVGTLDVVDQYGEDITGTSAATVTSVFVSNINSSATVAPVVSNNGTATPTISGLVAGDSYTLNVVYSNGKTATLQVVATDAAI